MSDFLTFFDVAEPSLDVQADRAGATADAGAAVAVVKGESDDRIRGTIRIAPAVLIELIELTVRDLPAVLALRSAKRSPAADDRPNEIPKTYEHGGVRVRIAGDRIDADLSIVIARGANVVELGRLIQQRVGEAAGRMLGMTVNEVNVHVAGIGDGETDGELVP
jgi:uncharacterized alkaline shock family protein YloU